MGHEGSRTAAQSLADPQDQRASPSQTAQDRRRIGLRRLRLVQAPVEGEAGSSFHFEINGQDLFAGGANWIPDDNLLERITPARYRERVAQAAPANASTPSPNMPPSTPKPVDTSARPNSGDRISVSGSTPAISPSG